MLPILLFNVVACLVTDKAQSLAKEHVEGMIDDLLPDDAKAELDKIIEEDPNYKRGFYAELLGYGHIKHYSENWAKWKYKSKFNEWPKYEQVTPVRPSKEITNYIKHLHIKERYSKRR